MGDFSTVGNRLDLYEILVAFPNVPPGEALESRFRRIRPACVDPSEALSVRLELRPPMSHRLEKESGRRPTFHSW
jgi:hypothetical protein